MLILYGIDILLGVILFSLPCNLFENVMEFQLLESNSAIIFQAYVTSPIYMDFLCFLIHAPSHVCF